MLAAVLTALTWAILGALAFSGHAEIAADRLSSVGLLLNSSTLVLAVVVGVIFTMRWRTGGRPVDLHVGLAVVLFGALKVGVGDVLPGLSQPTSADSSWVTILAALALVMVALVLARGTRSSSAVVARRARLRAVAPAVAVFATVMVALAAVPDVARVLSGQRTSLSALDRVGAGDLAVAGLWWALALVYGVIGWRRRSTTHLCSAVMLATLGQARIALALATPAATLWLVGSEALRLEAVLLAFVGVNRELHETFRSQHVELDRSLRLVDELSARERSEQAARQEQLHDLRSALFAIGNVARILEGQYDRARSAELGDLTRALSEEVARVRRLVSDRQREDRRPFALAQTLAPVVVCERSAGMDIELAIDETLAAFGRPLETVEVVQSLLDNARRYAPGSPVRIAAHPSPGGVVLRVEDHGPGVAMRDHRVIFERGWRGDAPPGIEGTGLGLYVAQRLMREQDGQLWVEDRVGGGASFVLLLPQPPMVMLHPISGVESTEAVDQPEHLGQAPNTDGPLTAESPA